jgi:hypothetical protein
MWGKPSSKRAHTVILCAYITHAYKYCVVSPYLQAACFDVLHFLGCCGFQSHASSISQFCGYGLPPRMKYLSYD